ncbi:queuosine precursor transporter [Aestuariispira insulae]|uniref:Probable queuosine precursor transporter n=1 Tax=Aestuariispira insulae TaxID=1461337 RepID=A0A3D9HXK4_9PROT|nr:queuosine precursor transporter [Aestuariispira insulae]RED54237.1 hypothetical protein DFP90_1011040 [Aestuariispira insulae]
MTFLTQPVIRLILPVFAMGAVILSSNELVQHPVEMTVGGIDLADLLTWGAFTYPIAFLVTDTTNRLFGAHKARLVVYIGFALGVFLTGVAALGLATTAAVAKNSDILTMLMEDEEAFAMLRTAVASGTAFLIAQLLDIAIFDRLRRLTWWKAPIFSSFAGSMIDTAIFFSIAFAGTGLPWMSWAAGDFCAKLVMIALLLYPFKLLVALYPSNLREA